MRNFTRLRTPTKKRSSPNCLADSLRSLSAGKIRSGFYLSHRHSFGTACTGFLTLFLIVLFIFMLYSAVSDTYTKRFRESEAD